MSVRNFVNLTMQIGETSCSDTNSVLTVPSQPNILVGTALSVHLVVKYVETNTLRFSTIHQGQKTRPHRRLVLKFATEVLPVRARGLCY